jgi:glycosyltransferase involved in cell wall biosynthesis
VIGLSLLTLNPEAAGGTLTYVRELARALARVGELEYHAYVPTIAPDVGDGLPTTVVHEYHASRGALGRVAGLTAAALSPGRLRKALRPDELDAIHFPLGVMLPRLKSPPAAATIHDLQHEVWPEFFSRAQLAYRRRVYGWTVRTSRIVLADSEHGRETLIERLGLDEARVRAIHLAVDHERFTPDGSPRGPFLLYPANAWRHKNHGRLFEAFAQVRRDRPELRLVLTGGRRHGHGRLVRADGVESRGHVTTDELIGLYRTAAALVYPSLYEGFGMPCLEAMACGCPVSCSRVASLPEICGDTAVYFDPHSAEDIARGIHDVLTSPPGGGVERAARFTWDGCARAHDAVYRELAAAGAGD